MVCRSCAQDFRISYIYNIIRRRRPIRIVLLYCLSGIYFSSFVAILPLGDSVGLVVTFEAIAWCPSLFSGGHASPLYFRVTHIVLLLWTQWQTQRNATRRWLSSSPDSLKTPSPRFLHPWTSFIQPGVQASSLSVLLSHILSLRPSVIQGMDSVEPHTMIVHWENNHSDTQALVCQLYHYVLYCYAEPSSSRTVTHLRMMVVLWWMGSEKMRVHVGQLSQQ